MNSTIKIRLALLASVVAISVLSAPATAQQKPNIVFILTDNLGYGEIGAYGGGITRGAATPRIDSLARDGMRFLNMNMETQCTPSRSSLMTGRFSIRSGTYAVPFGGVPDGLTQWEVTIANRCRTPVTRPRYMANGISAATMDGCRTIRASTSGTAFRARRTNRSGRLDGMVARHLAPEKIMEGKKGEKSRKLKVYDVEQRRLIDAEITRRSVAFIERQAKASKPFFAYVRLTQPHLPTNRIRPSRARPATAIGPTCWRRWITTSARCSMRWTNSAFATTPSSSSPATTGGVHPALGRLVRSVARPVFHRAGRRHSRAVPDPVARQDSRRAREQRDRAWRGHVRHARQVSPAPRCPPIGRWTVSISRISSSARPRSRPARVSPSGARTA